MALTDINEATPDTSSEEIAAYAAQVIQDVAAERQGEVDETPADKPADKPAEKSDAQIINEHASIPPSPKPKETPAEKKSGSNTAHDEGEKSGSATGSPKWLTDDVTAEAAAYGIDEAELADFASREELDRALKLIDKRAFEAGRKAQAEIAGQPRNELGQFGKQAEPKTDPPKEQAPTDGRYQVSLNPELYDEDIIGELSKMSEHYQSQIEAVKAQFDSYLSDQRAAAEVKVFDSFVDSLGHTDLFGETGHESEKELERRKALLDEVNTRRLGLERLGRSAEISEALVRLAARTVFADEFDKRLLKNQTRRISRQSNSRMGGSPTKPQPPSDSPEDRFDRLYREYQQS